MAGERHGHGMLCVNRPITARHGGGTAWARHAMCESAFSLFCFAVRYESSGAVFGNCSSEVMQGECVNNLE